MQINRAVHTAFNCPVTSSLASKSDHFSGCWKAVLGWFFYFGEKSSNFPTLSIHPGSRDMNFDVHHLLSRIAQNWAMSKSIAVYWCLGRDVLGGNRFLGSLKHQTWVQPWKCPFRDHLLQGQSLNPVPRPPPFPYTCFWPSIPVPASLGMKSWIELLGDCSA